LTKTSWFLVEFMMPLALTRAPGPVETKQPHNIKDPPSMRLFAYSAFRMYSDTWTFSTFCLSDTLILKVFFSHQSTTKQFFLMFENRNTLFT
jgi:hypothetical protein